MNRLEKSYFSSQYLRRSFVLVVCMVVAVFGVLSCLGQEDEPRDPDTVKAGLLAKFVEYGRFPEEIVPGKTLLIGFAVEEDRFKKFEELLDGKTKNGRTISVKLLANPNEAEGCAMLFIGDRFDSRPVWRELMVRSNSLLLGEGRDFLRRGGNVYFYTTRRDTPVYDIGELDPETDAFSLSAILMNYANNRKK